MYRYVGVMTCGAYCIWVNLRQFRALVLQTVHWKPWQRTSAGDDFTSPINYNYRSVFELWVLGLVLSRFWLKRSLAHLWWQHKQWCVYLMERGHYSVNPRLVLTSCTLLQSIVWCNCWGICWCCKDVPAYYWWSWCPGITASNGRTV